MGRALLVFESVYGNTRDVAAAVASGIRDAPFDVEIVEVSQAPLAIPDDVELVVVGAPTHAHGMTTPKSRSDAAPRAGDEGLISRGIGIREWLELLVAPSHPVAAAAFDTRISGPELLWGSAAKGVAKRLGALGFSIGEPQSFLIGGPSGPPTNRLKPGELAHARRWGNAIAHAVH